MRTHRCKQLLDKKDMSIRFSNPYANIICGDKPMYHDEWWLYKINSDWDYDVTYMSPICSIEFCPFCGENFIVEECLPLLTK